MSSMARLVVSMTRVFLYEFQFGNKMFGLTKTLERFVGEQDVPTLPYRKSGFADTSFFGTS